MEGEQKIVEWGQYELPPTKQTKKTKMTILGRTITRQIQQKPIQNKQEVQTMDDLTTIMNGGPMSRIPCGRVLKTISTLLPFAEDRVKAIGWKALRDPMFFYNDILKKARETLTKPSIMSQFFCSKKELRKKFVEPLIASYWDILRASKGNRYVNHDNLKRFMTLMFINGRLVHNKITMDPDSEYFKNYFDPFLIIEQNKKQVKNQAQQNAKALKQAQQQKALNQAQQQKAKKKQITMEAKTLKQGQKQANAPDNNGGQNKA